MNAHQTALEAHLLQIGEDGLQRLFIAPTFCHGLQSTFFTGAAHNADTQQPHQRPNRRTNAAINDEIMQGLKKGKISQEDLRRCCSNVVRSIMNSAIQKEYIK